MDKLLSEFSFGLFFWQCILFIGLILLLRKFAWNPILNAVNEREEGIKKALESAEEAKKEMQNLTSDNEALVKEARAERDAMLKEAREIREKMISEAKEDAKEQGAKMIENAIIAIDQEKQAALAHLKKEVGELSIVIAEAVIKKELTSQEDQVNLVEGMLKDVTLN
jgi:F-type H+-transporting ATPase subunit b